MKKTEINIVLDIFHLFIHQDLINISVLFHRAQTIVLITIKEVIIDIAITAMILCNYIFK